MRSPNCFTSLLDAFSFARLAGCAAAGFDGGVFDGAGFVWASAGIAARAHIAKNIPNVCFMTVLQGMLVLTRGNCKANTGRLTTAPALSYAVGVRARRGHLSRVA